MSNRSALLLLLTCLMTLIFSSAAAAGPAEESETARSYHILRKEYLALVKSDAAAAETEQWAGLAESLHALLGSEPDPEYSPKILFLLGRLHEYLFRKRNQPGEAQLAFGYYRRLVQDYRSGDLVDDALLAIGDLERDALRDPDAARAAYSDLLERFPRGDMAAQAQSRLKKTKAGTGKAKAAKPEPAAVEVKADSPAAKPEDQGFFSFMLWSQSDEEPKAAAPPFPPHPLAKRLKREVTVVLDPGHGGEEEGALGVGGVFEKEVVLNVSMFLEEQLRKRLGVKVVLTRVRDVTLPLAERTRIANESNADLFISVHTNASKTKSASGIETYYLDNTDDKSSLRLAERENASMLKEQSDLGFILSDLIQNAKLDDSISLAHTLHDRLHKTIAASHPGTKNLGVKKAPFYVLVGAHMPCVLLEVSFIDHKVEGQRLITYDYQRLIAGALFEGIVDYLNSRSDLVKPAAAEK